MDGRIKKVEDFLKTRLLDTLAEQLTKVTKVPDYNCITLKLYCKCKWNRSILKDWKKSTNLFKAECLVDLLLDLLLLLSLPAGCEQAHSW